MINLRRLSMLRMFPRMLFPDPIRGPGTWSSTILSGIPRALYGMRTDSWSPFPGIFVWLGTWPLWLSICHCHSRLASLSRRTRPARLKTQTIICFPPRIIRIPRYHLGRRRPWPAMVNEVECFYSLSKGQSFQNTKCRKVQTKGHHQTLQCNRDAPVVRGGIPSLITLPGTPEIMGRRRGSSSLEAPRPLEFVWRRQGAGGGVVRECHLFGSLVVAVIVGGIERVDEVG